VIAEVKAVLNAQKFLSEPTINEEVEHFFNRLGLDEFFFEGQSAESLANFVASLATAKMIAKMTKTKLNVTLNSAESEGVFAKKRFPLRR
jgi:NAD-specific glutamate dehydrogenase